MVTTVADVPTILGTALPLRRDFPDCWPQERVQVGLMRSPYRKDDVGPFARLPLGVREMEMSDGQRRDRDYLNQEVSDCVEMPRWLTRRCWCNGLLAIWVSSWSADISLRLICRESSFLDVAVTIQSYSDLDQSDAQSIDTVSDAGRDPLLPERLSGVGPSPSHVDDGDFELRFANSRWLFTLLDKVEDYEFWRFRPASVGCARLLMVEGWLDGYSDSVYNLLDEPGVLVAPRDHVTPELDGSGVTFPWFGCIVDWLYRYSIDGAEWSRNPSPPELTIIQSVLHRRFRAIRSALSFTSGLMLNRTPAPTYSHIEPLAYGRKMVTEWPVTTTSKADWSQLHSGVHHWQRSQDADVRCKNRVRDDECGIDSAFTIGVEVGRRWSGFNEPSSRTRRACFDTGPLTEPIEVPGLPSVKARISAQQRLFVRLVCIYQVGQAAPPTSNDVSAIMIATRLRMWSLALALALAHHSLTRGHRLEQWASAMLWPLAMGFGRSVDMAIDSSATIELLISLRLSVPWSEPHTRLGSDPQVLPAEDGEEVPSTVSADCWRGAIGSTWSVSLWRSGNGVSGSHTNSLGFGVLANGEGAKFNMHGCSDVISC